MCPARFHLVPIAFWIPKDVLANGSSELACRVASAPTWSLPIVGTCVRPDRSAKWLLRKEVIQPHLPVRLPCYDFTPIASPTFDGSLPKGLGHRLRVLPTFVV